MPDRPGNGTHPLPRKASLSLAAAFAAEKGEAKQPLAGGGGADRPELMLPLIVQATTSFSHLAERLKPKSSESLVSLTEGLFSARLSTAATHKLLSLPEVHFVQRKSTYEAHLEDVLKAACVPLPADAAVPPEDGAGVLVGIVDSGFDLSHPAFRSGDRLRVDALLDQIEEKEYDGEELEKLWAAGSRPGFDASGHGTHVASIAAGSPHAGVRGVAPGARFLLVRTNFVDTDVAVAWIFQKAAGRPCVINLSLGGHGGGHDGTTKEEYLHGQVTGPGKILVAAAGNDREHAVHLGHSFHSGERQEIAFDIGVPPAGYPRIVVRAWRHPEDTFDLEVLAPDGTPYSVPRLGRFDLFEWRTASIFVAGEVDERNQLHSSDIEIHFRGPADPRQLLGWRLRIHCEQAVYGRLDAWIKLSTQGRFHPHTHTLVATSGTLCEPATGPGCIAVGSFVSRCDWTCETHPTHRVDQLAVKGRASRFSALGPTRDGRWKPEISAPGEHVTAALAGDSTYSQFLDRSRPQDKLVTVGGTSMAAPVVTGVIALMLQRRPALTLDQARAILRDCGRHDTHTGPALWTPVYGYGKIDALAALAKL